jgi:hypothetical protein
MGNFAVKRELFGVGTPAGAAADAALLLDANFVVVELYKLNAVDLQRESAWFQPLNLSGKKTVACMQHVPLHRGPPPGRSHGGHRGRRAAPRPLLRRGAVLRFQ